MQIRRSSRGICGSDPDHRPDRLIRASSDGPLLAALLAAAVALGSLAEPAAAQEAELPSLSFDGYGTFGLVYSTESDADYLGNPLRPHGPGHTETVSPDVDSRLAGQLSARLTEEFMAVVQVVAEQDAEDRYTPGVEWAYLSYDVTRDLTVRVGRRPLSQLLVSDFRKVSYANPWVRPPVEVYSLSPVFTGDGIDVTWRFRTGDWSNALQASFGRAEDEFPDGTIEANRVWSVNHVVQRGGLTGRFALTTGELDIQSFDPLFDQFREFGGEGKAIAERFEVDDTRIHLASVAAEYDSGSWFAVTELGWTDLNSVLGERLAGYVSGGYRFGKITPYATYSRVGALHERSAAGLSLEGLPPEQAQAAATLNATLDRILASAPIQGSVTVGGRWDFRPGMAAKLQLDLVDMMKDSPGTFVNAQPDFERGGSAQLVTFAMAFVF